MFNSTCCNENSGLFLSCLVINSEGKIIAGTTNGIYILNENENKWEKTSNANVSSLFIDSNEILYAGGNDGLIYSDNGGKNWIKISFADTSYDAHGIALTKDLNGNLYAGTSMGIFVSIDKGKNWTTLNFKNTSIKSILVYLKNYIFAGTWGKGIYRSSNNGKDWEVCNKGLSRKLWINSLKAHKNKFIFIGTDNNYVYRSSDNGDSWKQLNNGLKDSSIISLDISPEGRLYISNNFSIYYSDDYGDNWTETESDLNEFISCFSLNQKGHVFAGSLDGKIFKSSDNGITWHIFSDILQ